MLSNSIHTLIIVNFLCLFKKQTDCNMFGNPLQKGPKAWTSFYKSKIRHLGEQNNFLSNLCVTLQKYHRSCTNYWLRSKERRTKVYFAQFGCSRKEYEDLIVCEGCRESFYNLTRPTGERQVQFGNVATCVKPSTWIIRMNKELRMNINFHQIVIKFGKLGMCFEPLSFVIKSVLSQGADNQKFVFCGVLNQFAFYLPSHLSQLIFSCSDKLARCYKNYKVLFIFTVIDKDRIQNQPVSNSSIRAHSLREKFVQNVNELVLSYVLSVQKNFCINISLSSLAHTEFHIFDGPTKMSRRLKLSDHLTSTFQAWLSVITLMQNQTGYERHDIHFSPVMISLSTNISVGKNESMTKTFALNTAQFVPILLRVIAPMKHHVQVKFYKVIFTGPMSYQCTLGGISALDVTGVEVLSLCEPHDGEKSLSQRVFSLYSDLMVVLYRYESFGTISADLKFQVTRCVPILIDVCLSRSVCVNTTNMQLEFRKNPNRKHSIMWFTPKDRRMCFVVQVLSIEITHQMFSDPCFLKIYDYRLNRLNVSSAHVHILFSAPVEGFLKPDPFSKLFSKNSKIKSHSNFSTKDLFGNKEGIYEPGVQVDIQTEITMQYGFDWYIMFEICLHRQFYSSFWLDMEFSFSTEDIVFNPVMSKILGLPFHPSLLTNVPIDGVQHVHLLVTNPRGAFPGKSTLHVVHQLMFYHMNYQRRHINEMKLSFGEVHQVVAPVPYSLLVVPKSSNKAFVVHKPPQAVLKIRSPETQDTIETIAVLKSCHTTNQKNKKSVFLCHNASHLLLQTERNHSSMLVLSNTCNEGKRFSWVEAAAVCRDFGGTLLSFHSTKDIDMIQHLVVKHFHSCQIFAFSLLGIYLGLNFNPNKKVGF